MFDESCDQDCDRGRIGPDSREGCGMTSLVVVEGMERFLLGRALVSNRIL